MEDGASVGKNRLHVWLSTSRERDGVLELEGEEVRVFGGDEYV